MYSYTFRQWLSFFYLYCIFGWCFESAYVSLKQLRPVNRGFLKGPWLPLYGSGAILVLWMTLPFQNSPVEVYVVGLVGATVLEYFTGEAMVRLFKVRYWDYSSYPYNFHGYICLFSAIGFGIAGMLWICVFSNIFRKYWFSLPPGFRRCFNSMLVLLFLTDCAAALIFPNAGHGITF